MDQAALTIRSAQPEDLPLIARLIRELAEFERLSGEAVFDESELARNLFGATPYAEVLIAEVEGEASGFALYFHTFSTFLGKPGIYLEDLFVAPEHRRRGIGRALLGQLAKIAVERGCGRLEWAVLDWNENAIRFYRQLGARPNKGWTVHRISGESLDWLARSL